MSEMMGCIYVERENKGSEYQVSHHRQGAHQYDENRQTGRLGKSERAYATDSRIQRSASQDSVVS